MRFKNLTITLTLTCLAIVALAGLTLMPITEGICEWTYDSSQESASFFNYTSNWNLSASLSANAESASADATPSIRNKKFFRGNQYKTWDYTGNVQVYVYKSACNARVVINNCWSSHHQRYVPVYGYREFPEAEDPDDSNAEDSLLASIQIVRETGKDIIWEEDSDPTNTITTRVGINDVVDVTAERTWGGKKYGVQTVNIIDKLIPQEQDPVTRSANVSGHPEAHKWAQITGFSFGWETITDKGESVSGASGTHFSWYWVFYDPPE